jgi:cbb3-type cytochrome oxidase maturation protein
MNAIIILIPITLVLLAFVVGLFFWAVRHDQFRNLDTPEILPILDDEPLPPKEISP